MLELCGHGRKQDVTVQLLVFRAVVGSEVWASNLITGSYTYAAFQDGMITMPRQSQVCPAYTGQTLAALLFPIAV